MQRYIFRALLNCGVMLCALGCCGLGAALAADGVCSVGTGIPPFLSSGVNPNLLLVFDNSGSMLDVAYNDTTNSGACVDNDFDPAKTYAGLFEKTTWYKWQAVSGYFQPVPKSCVDAQGALMKCDLSEITPLLGDRQGVVYSQNDLYADIQEVVEIVDGRTVNVQKSVFTFAATGNMLNWASASKFDIQKKILTGGKYDGARNVLISEGRGCSGSGYKKEVKVNGNLKTITFSVRGPNEDEQSLDPTDATTRITILGVTDNGFIGSTRSAACQTVINEFNYAADNDPTTKPNQGTIKGSTGDCLAYPNVNNVLAASNAAYNDSIHECWRITVDLVSNFSELQITNMQQSCQKIYTGGILPATIDPWDSGYVCHGVFGSTTDETNYVGRCWVPGNLPVGCAFTPCSPGNDVVDSLNKTRCSSSDNLLYKCDKNITGANPPKCTGIWYPVLKDDSDPATTACLTTAQVEVGTWTSTTTDQCIQRGLWDYCKSLTVPEVIDPSDNLYNSNETWGMVGALIDSGVIAMFGTDTPLLVMKGHIYQAEKPQGKIQEYKDQLRMGAMAFNINGAETECNETVVNSTIVKYCPSGALDGAQVIASIKNSDSMTDGKQHIDYLVERINAIPADSWTPLAEALYNALGYYGQNENLRLHTQDFNITTADDPVQAWCQANNILLITEGSSTADVNPTVASKVSAMAAQISGYTFTPALEGECTATGVTAVGTSTTQHYLYGSTYLDNLTYFGQHAIAAGVYPAGKQTFASDDGPEYKQDIRTYVIKTGNPSSNLTGDCNPATLMEKAAASGGTALLDGSDPSKLDASIRSALNDILSRASAGSAASVISSARSGEGAIYQAIFWPELKGAGASTDEPGISWVGDVHGLLVDSKGQMYEDTDGNRALNPTTADLAGDKLISIYYDKEDGVSKGCRGGVTYSDEAEVVCENPDDSVALTEINFLWSAHAELAKLYDYEVLNNRSLDSDEKFIYDTTNSRKRYIFTWNDDDRDGVVEYDAGEIVPFEAAGGEVVETAAWKERAREYNITTEDVVTKDSGQTGYVLNSVIHWIRGKDWVKNSTTVPSYSSRSRTLDSEMWRLGDVINSTPQTVTSPAEGYHQIYNDRSYADFVSKYKKRRHVVYFGGNDGMMHAVNAGFYSEDEGKFCLKQTQNSGVDIGKCQITDESGGPLPLGAELWAYVPYNLHPHLKCLTLPEYTHKYYVDLRPRVFDVQIFDQEDACSGASGFSSSQCIHPKGWGTILVGGMRFGGAPDTVESLAGTSLPFVSSYFILDITDPERPPVLLAEMTQELDQTTKAPKWGDLGYSTVVPTVAVMKTVDSTTGSTTINKWYLVMGSGPHGPSGQLGKSDQKAQVSIVYLGGGINGTADLTYGLVNVQNKPQKALRIRPIDRTVSDELPVLLGKTLSLPPSDETTTETTRQYYGFVSDPITVDFDINPSAKGQYVSDAIYFGTVEENASGAWQGGGGHLYRLVMNENGHTVKQDDTASFDTWAIKPLLDLSGTVSGNFVQPITGAPSVGLDDQQNYWIYFGTGRFFDSYDKADFTQQTYYGIKEPSVLAGGNKKLTWAEVKINGAADTDSGVKGKLQRVDPIKVKLSGSGDTPIECTVDCPPSGVDTFNELEAYISASTDGWYKHFTPLDNRERNLGQATLLGGLVTFTTYKPFSDLCKAEGDSYLYGVYYKTGTSWYKNVFGDYGTEKIGENTYVLNKLILGQGLTATPNLFTSADQDGVKAFIQTSTGEIREILQENLPIETYKTGRERWREYQCQ